MEKGIDNSQQRAQKQMRCDVAVVVNKQMGVLVGLLCWCKQQGKCFVEAWGRRRHFFDRSPTYSVPTLRRVGAATRNH
jgi:hypothetical protein